VLTAGLGTRLRPLTYVRAKAAVPVNGEPLVRRVIRWLVAEGVSDLVLNLHHRPATITAVLGDGSDLGARVRYSLEHPVLGSAGGPRRALPLLMDRRASRSPILLVNGDTLTDVSIAALLAEHATSQAAVTMALIPNPHPDKYGGVVVSPEGWVTGFTRRGAGGDSYHFIGVQAAQPDVFAGLEDGVPVESVGGVYPRLMAEHPRSVRAFVSNAIFRDIGTPFDYLQTSLALAEQEGDRLAGGACTSVASSARTVRTAVWDDVMIGAGAQLTDCIVCDGARIPDGARYEGFTIVPAAGRQPIEGEQVQGSLLVRPIQQ
jgi:NDP-sugar pyrophosphorylase family protein